MEKEVESPAGETPTEQPKKPSKPKKKSFPDFLTGHINRYPAEKVFHVTSDRQVFLDKDYHLAKLHQRNLGKGEIKSYNI